MDGNKEQLQKVERFILSVQQHSFPIFATMKDMKALLLFLVLVLVLTTCTVPTNSETQTDVVPECSIFVPPDYVKTIAPTNLTNVKFQYDAPNVESVDVQDNSFTIRMSIFLRWIDERLSPVSILKSNLYFQIDYETFKECLWRPRFSAIEMKSMKVFDDEFSKPSVVMIRGGELIWHATYMFQMACSMELVLFPNDIQSCEIIFQSFHVSRTKLDFTQVVELDLNGIRKNVTRDSNYELVYTNHEENENLHRIISSKLRLQFVFRRRIDLYLMTTYFPSILATIVSFTSFWLHPDAVPGRVTLGVTCLLALMTQMSSVRSAIPNTNYVTSIDIWFLACITIVTLSLFEFALSYTFSRNQKIQYLRVNVKNPSKFKKFLWKLSKRSIDHWSRVLFPVTFLFFVTTYLFMIIKLSDERLEKFIKTN